MSFFCLILLLVAFHLNVYNEIGPIASSKFIAVHYFRSLLPLGSNIHAPI